MNRIMFSKTGELPDGTPVYDLHIGGELKAQRIPLDEVVRRIRAFKEVAPSSPPQTLPKIEGETLYVNQNRPSVY